MSEIEPKYLVLASQRSGSTLLVESLAATSIAGRPQEFFQYLPHSGLAPQPREWFADVTDPAVLALLAPLVPGTAITETAEDWRTQILRDGATSNGVWGGKLMWNQTPLLIDRARALQNPPPEASLRSAIAAIVGDDVVFVRVTRDDVVAQAVSFWRAVQTGVWRGRTDPEKDARARYNADGIAHLVAELRRQQRGWDSWLAETGISPLVVTFEELTANPSAQVNRVLAALGLPTQPEAPPVLERQGNSRSHDWATQYRADAAKRGLPL